MPIFLRNRAEHLTEHMDQPDCDYQMLIRTYQQFRLMNPLISRWRFIYKRYLLPYFEADTQNTLLDIGFGGGDILLCLSRWAKQDGLHLKITGIEIDKRALNYAQTLHDDPNIEFKLSTFQQIKEHNQKYDFVISNHFLHHLNKDELTSTLKETSELAARRVIFNDIERSDLAYLGFGLFLGPFLRKSFARPDGLRSIRRSYTRTELDQLVPGNWRVVRIFPFRLLLIYDR